MQATNPSPTKHNSLNRTKIEFVLSVAFLATLTGCIYGDGRRQERVYAEPAPVYVSDEFAMQDNYVYYPSYQVYYSNQRRQYVYLEGRSWVTRPTPPRVPVNVLAASPSVRLEFHDSPARHHATVVRQYPKNWSPSDQDHRKGSQNDGRGNDWENHR